MVTSWDRPAAAAAAVLLGMLLTGCSSQPPVPGVTLPTKVGGSGASAPAGTGATGAGSPAPSATPSRTGTPGSSPGSDPGPGSTWTAPAVTASPTLRITEETTGSHADDGVDVGGERGITDTGSTGQSLQLDPKDVDVP